MTFKIMTFFLTNLFSFAIFAQQVANDDIYFLTSDSSQNVSHLNRINFNRSIYSKKLLLNAQLNRYSATSFKTTKDLLITFSSPSSDQTSALHTLIINRASGETKIIAFPASTQAELGISHLIALSANKFLAASNSTKSVYLITTTTTGIPQVSRIYTQQSVLAASFKSFELSDDGLNLLFSFDDGQERTANIEKVFYSYSLAAKKVKAIDANVACTGALVYISGKPITLITTGKFVTYCSNFSASSFLEIDLTLNKVTSYHTDLLLNENSNFAVDANGSFLNVSSNERPTFCSGNITKNQSLRCGVATFFPGGKLIRSNLSTQFYTLTSNALYFVNFTSGQTQKSSVFFNDRITGTILPPFFN